MEQTAENLPNYDGAYANPKIKGLLESVNEASAAARNGWILFIAAMAYFFVALAGVTHRDFLLNTPVNQPILQVEVDLQSFFLFAPLVLVFVHFGILIQHEMLAGKVRALDHVFTRHEGPNAYRTHPMRRQLHAYFFTQSIAGPRRSKLLLWFLNAMSWGTLFFLPIATLLAFQITYLPYHDAETTAWHQWYLVADIVIYLIMGTLYRFLDAGFFRGLSLNVRHNTAGFFGTNLVALFAIFFSFCIATLPDSTLDVAMRKIWPEPVPYGQALEKGEGKSQRVAFWPTAYLFEGPVDEGNSETKSIFARNLVVVNADLVKDSEWNPKETTLSLRARNLSYSTFDRSDLRGTDFTSSVLHNARFYETNLHSVKFDSAQMKNTDMRRAIFAGRTTMIGADLQGANLRDAKFGALEMRHAQLQGAQLQGISVNRESKIWYLGLAGADLRGAQLQKADLGQGWLVGAIFEGANLQGANLSRVKAQGAKFDNAQLQGANLNGAKLAGASLRGAQLQAASLQEAELRGTDLSGAQLQGTDLIKTKIWMVPTLSAEQITLAGINDLKIEPSKGYYGEYRVLRNIKDKKIRKIVKKRLERLLDHNASSAWATSDEHRAWQTLNGQKPDAEELSNLFGKLACADSSKEAYLANALVYRVERRFSRYSDRINPETFLQLITDKTCLPGQNISPAAMGELFDTVEEYRTVKKKQAAKAIEKKQQSPQQPPAQQ